MNRRRSVLRSGLLFALAHTLVPPAAAQEPADSSIADLITRIESAQEAPEAGPAIRVFLDCQGALCDFDHFRREILFVDWVRDRQDADLHLLLTEQATGAGGVEITIQVIGRGEYERIDDRLTYTTSATDTQQETRAGLTQALKLALARFLVGTERAGWMRLVYAPPSEVAGQARPGDDPWSFWVFRMAVSGSYSGEERTSSVSLNGDFSADRTTEAFKFNLFFGGRYLESNFDLNDSTTIKSIFRSYNGRFLLVKSAGEHFSYGAQGRFATSTFSNQDLFLRFAPAFEINLFPYSQSTRRQLRLLYTIGVTAYDYTEETIFDRTEETRFDQSLSISLSLTEPWGSAQLALQGSHILDDVDQNRLTLFGLTDIRLVRGLSFSLFGSVSHIADQRNLPKGGATEEEILLRRKELATSFLFSASVGLSYTFGSTFSNVVNPRLGG